MIARWDWAAGVTQVNELEREWLRLLRSETPKQRGYEFEAFIESLLRREHFNVEKKPVRANGRQVDLFASRGTAHYLFETKWKNKAANIDDIDNLLTRLSTAAPTVVGVLVSHTGFASTVIDRVARTANRPVLLISGIEIDALISGSVTVAGLLQQKLNRLTRHQQVSLDEVFITPVPRDDIGSPPSSLHMLLPDGTPIDYWEGDGSFDPIVFTIEQADIDWVVGGGNGVTLDIDLGIGDQAGLLSVVEELSHLGWVSRAGFWSINQSHISWTGLGSASLVKHLAGWLARYAGRDMHPTEQVIYTDICDNGFYSLTSDVFVHESRHVRNSRLSFQLTGIPLDIAPLQSLVEAFGEIRPPFFRPRSARAVTSARLTPPHLPQQALAYVVAREEGSSADDWVIGVVLPDPGTELDAEGRIELGLSPEPHGPWLCRLKSWHPFSESRLYEYEVVRSASTSDIYALEVMVDWADTDDDSFVDEAPMNF